MSKALTWIKGWWSWRGHLVTVGLYYLALQALAPLPRLRKNQLSFRSSRLHTVLGG